MKTKILGAMVALFTLVFSLNTAAIAGSDHHTKVGDIMIVQPWARASANQKVGAGFMKLINSGGADKLLSASSDVAKKVEIHLTSMDTNGMMAMKKQDFVAIPEKDEVILKPGSYHVMFMKLNRQMIVGEIVSVELEFEKAGKVTVKLPIQKAGSKSAHSHTH